MIFTDSYESPLGSILLAGDEEGLTGENTFHRIRVPEPGGGDAV